MEPTEEDLANDPTQKWELDGALSLRDRWLSLVSPADLVATNIATQGLTIDWLRDPPPLSQSVRPPRHLITHSSKFPVLKPLVKDWVKRGILTKTQIPAYVYFSRMFYVGKKNGKFRPILDLSVLNTFIQTPTFQMETLDWILRFVTKIMWATSIDVTDAYLTIPISILFQHYFCFELDGIVYMFLKLPFGLTTAPWAFSRVMRPIKSCLRLRGVQVSSFIDDFLILAVTSAQSLLHTKWTQNLLQWLGFQINFEKSSLSPLQSIEYLGVLLNLRNLTMALPLDKVNKIMSICQTTSSSFMMTRRQLESLVGLLNFAHPLLPLGRMHLTPIITWMNQHTSPALRDINIPIDASLKEALLPFQEKRYLSTPVSFQQLVPSLDISTDASDHAWSCVLLPFRIQDCWTQWERSRSINWKEVKAIYNTLSFFQDNLSGRVIRIHTDSMVALFCLRRMGSLNSPETNDILRQLLLLCHRRNIVFQVVHISGCLNVLADQGSRVGPITTEWCLDPESFDWIFHQFPCFPQVDLFATRANSRFSRYVSPCPDERAYFQDALHPQFNLESPFPVHLCFSSPKVDARFNRSNLSVRVDNGPDSSSYQRSLEFQITHESSTMETSSSEVLPISGSKSRDCVPGVQVLESFCLADSASKPEVSVGDAPSLGDEKSRCSPVPRMSSDVSQLGGPFLDQEDLDSFILDSFDEGELRMVQVDGERDLTTSQIKTRLEVWAHGLRTKGFSPEASSLIVGSHKNSSQHQYQSGWKQWLNYLK